jgi:hemerythrin-like metal-binding protein
MTKLVKWNEGFSVGVEEIDEQHKTLFDVLAKLVEATKPGEQKKKVGALLEEMADYAEYHFGKEEAYLHKHPDFSFHLEQHREFVEKTIQLKKNYLEEDGSSGLTHHNALVFLFSWLQKHILECDVRFFSTTPKQS